MWPFRGCMRGTIAYHTPLRTRMRNVAVLYMLGGGSTALTILFAITYIYEQYKLEGIWRQAVGLKCQKTKKDPGLFMQGNA